jgi:hypothetical protein
MGPARLCQPHADRPGDAADSTPIGELTGSPAVIAQLPDQIRVPLTGAFSEAITGVFAIALPFTLIALVLVIVLPELPLRDTAHVGAPTEL